MDALAGLLRPASSAVRDVAEGIGAPVMAVAAQAHCSPLPPGRC